MADGGPLLSWETSADTEPERSSSLPDSVVSCLQNARYLHLATCVDQKPHVSLMNYTYLPTYPFPSASRGPSQQSSPVIIMTSNPSSRKTLNLQKNPNVSLLVHDWVSHRPPNSSSNSQSTSTNTHGTQTQDADGSSGPATSSLASLLMGINTSALGSISATINGSAQVLEDGSEEESWCKRAHLENNTFGDETSGAGQNAASAQGSAEHENVKVVVVRIQDGRISDWKGRVRDFVLEAGV